MASGSATQTSTSSDTFYAPATLVYFENLINQLSILLDSSVTSHLSAKQDNELFVLQKKLSAYLAESFSRVVEVTSDATEISENSENSDNSEKSDNSDNSDNSENSLLSAEEDPAEDSSRVKEEVSSAADNSSCAEEDLSSAAEDSSSAEEDLSSEAEDSSGAEEDLSSAEEDLSSAEEDCSSAAKNSSLAEENLSIAAEDSLGAEENLSSVAEDSSGADEDPSSAAKDYSYAEDDLSIAAKNSLSTEEDVSSAAENSLCAEEDLSIEAKDSSSTEEDLSSASDGKSADTRSPLSISVPSPGSILEPTSESNQNSSNSSSVTGKSSLSTSRRSLESKETSPDYSTNRDEILHFHEHPGNQNRPSGLNELIAQWESLGISYPENAASKSDLTSGPSTNLTIPVDIEHTSSTSNLSTGEPLLEQLPAWQVNAIRPRPSSRPDGQPAQRTPLFVPHFVPSRLCASSFKSSLKKTLPPAPIDPVKANRVSTVPSQSPSPSLSSSPARDSEGGISDADDSDGDSYDIRTILRCVFLIGPNPSPISTDFFSKVGECF
ncbi:hypothetical protein MMC07_001838 [Pseudocyphellaria aurata]|nr:hypothetical protein [Pseudocyphellaria aurata]